jgi:long-chain acyl-CoA synthetase
MSIVTLLHDSTRKFSSKAAIIENEQEISYAELWNRIERLSAAFHKIGIGENQRVALILPNSSEFIFCFFALLKANAAISPLSPDLTLFELKGIFNNLNPHAIISLPVFIEKVLNEEPSLLYNKTIITQSGVNISVNSENQVKKFYELNDLYGLYIETSYKLSDNQIDVKHMATINYTYRGIGYPLGAMLSHENYIQGAAFYIERTELDKQHRVLLLLPAYHVFPLMGGIIAPLLVGASVVIANSYIISHILRTIEKCKISMLLAVPSIYYLLLKYADRNQHDISSLTYCITGGDYMPAQIQQEISRKLDAVVLQGYGLTECLPVTCNPPSKNKIGSLGPSGRRDVKIKIIDECGIEKKIGEVGEILVSSPTVMAGYYGLDEETRKVLSGGWLYTGDYGYLDSEGYLYFSGRKKNIVKTGGKPVDLEEVQNVLMSHPGVSHARVYAKKDDLWGHVIVAELASRFDGVSTAEIKAFCSKRLSKYKVPKELVFKPEVAEQ